MIIVLVCSYEMGNIQSYEPDCIVATSPSAQVIADQLNEQAEEEQMAMAWQDVQRSLGSDYGVVGKLKETVTVLGSKQA